MEALSLGSDMVCVGVSLSLDPDPFLALHCSLDPLKTKVHGYQAGRSNKAAMKEMSMGHSKLGFTNAT